MFLFAPRPPCVLCLDGKKNHFFPMHRFRYFDPEGEIETSFIPESVVTVRPKETLDFALKREETFFFFLGAAFGTSSVSPLGWVTGVMALDPERFEAREIFVSPVREAKKTIDPVDTVAWVMAQNATSFSESVLAKMGNLNETMGYCLANDLVTAGDVLTVGVKIAVKEPGEYRFGMNGVGTLNLRCDKCA